MRERDEDDLQHGVCVCVCVCVMLQWFVCLFTAKLAEMGVMTCLTSRLIGCCKDCWYHLFDLVASHAEKQHGHFILVQIFVAELSGVQDECNTAQCMSRQLSVH